MRGTAKSRDYPPHKGRDFFMNKLVGISLLIISLAIAYFLVIYIPQQNRLSQIRQFQHEQELKSRKEKQTNDVQNCIQRGSSLPLTLEQAKWYVSQCHELYAD